MATYFCRFLYIVGLWILASLHVLQDNSNTRWCNN